MELYLQYPISLQMINDGRAEEAKKLLKIQKSKLQKGKSKSLIDGRLGLNSVWIK